jgi:hypothetical protein
VPSIEIRAGPLPPVQLSDRELYRLERVHALAGGLAVNAEHLAHRTVEPHLGNHLEVVWAHEHREMR